MSLSSCICWGLSAGSVACWFFLVVVLVWFVDVFKGVVATNGG